MILQIKFGKTLMFWQERMNAQDRNKNLKVHIVQGAVVKGAFAICEVTNTLINLKNTKYM